MNIFAPYNKKPPATVKESFWNDMDLFRYAKPNMEAHVVEFDPKVYSDLTEWELAYYLRWRKEVTDGLNPKYCTGCAWLRMCEIIDDREMPVEDALRELGWIVERMKENFRESRFLVESIIEEYEISRGIGHTAYDFYQMTRERITLQFSSPVIHLDANYLAYLCNYDDYDFLDDEFSDFVTETLVGIDEMLMKSTGKGFADNHFKSTILETCIFNGLPYRHERNYVVEGYELDGRGKKVLLGLFKYCYKLYYERRLQVPGEFDDRMRRIADDAYEWEGKYHWSTEEKMLTYVPKSEFMEMVGPSESGGTKRTVRPTLHFMTSTRGKIHPDFYDRIRDYWTLDHPEPMKYVESGNTRPEYHFMSPEQIRYHLHWRGRVLEGEYLETDDGHIWLLLCELLHMEKDHERCVSVMEGLMRNYRLKACNWVSEANIIQATYLDYSIYHGLRSDSPEYTDYCHSAYSAVLNLLEKQVPLPRQTVTSITNIKRGNILDDFDDDCAAILSNVILRIDKDARRGFLKHHRIKHAKGKTRLFEYVSFKYPDSCRTFEYDYLDFLDSGPFIEDMNDVVKDVVKTVKMRNGGRKQKMSGRSCFGIDCETIIREETDKWFSRSVKVEEREITLDAEALRNAESDLDRVIELMGVEESDDGMGERKPKEEKTKKTPGGLTPLQIEYIRTVLDGGDSVSFLKSKRRSRQTVESGINDFAMMEMGDTVIEDGEPVEEYIDWLRGMCD